MLVCNTPTDCIGAVRPNPARGNLIAYESSGVVNQNRINVNVRANINQRFSMLLEAITWASQTVTRTRRPTRTTLRVSMGAAVSIFGIRLTSVETYRCRGAFRSTLW